MSGKRILVLSFIFAASFLLLAFAAFIPTFAAKEEVFIPSAEGYQSIVAESGGNKKKISGCLPQDEIAEYFEESLDGLIGDITVVAAEDILTVKGKLLSDSEKLIEKFPQLEEAIILADIVAGAEATVKIRITYDENNGFSSEIIETKLAELNIPTDIFSQIPEDIENGLNDRIKDDMEIHSWQLREGGLYYSVTLENEDDISLIFPIA